VVDQLLGDVEVVGYENAHVVGVTILGERREPDEIDEENGDHPPLDGGPRLGCMCQLR